MPAALAGITVLDFTRLLPGPFCTQLLCNLGAEVIKIEDPKLGDYMRSVPPIVHDVSYPFLMVNRGKRSLAVAVYDTGVTLMGLGLARFLATGEEPVAGETLLTGSFPFYSLYETKDGRWLSVATVEPKFWSRMCELIGAPDLASKQFMDGAERFAVAQALAERFRGRTLAEWEALLGNENLPIAGVKRVSEVVHDPQVKARGLLPVVDVSGLWKLQVIAHPAKHATLETRNPTRVPAKGHDTEEILRSLGYTARRIQTLAKNGVVAM